MFERCKLVLVTTCSFYSLYILYHPFMLYYAVDSSVVCVNILGFNPKIV